MHKVLSLFLWQLIIIAKTTKYFGAKNHKRDVVMCSERRFVIGCLKMFYRLCKPQKTYLKFEIKITYHYQNFTFKFFKKFYIYIKTYTSYDSKSPILEFWTN